MNITQALSLRGQLDSYERQEASWLLGHILNVSALALKLCMLQELTLQQEQQYLDGLIRLSKGEPLAYIIGSQPFWTLDLTVSTDTLVPRPDTEVVIETVLTLDLPEHANVVDLGTGTGAIALSLASEHPNWHVVATDAYAATLEIAKENAKKHGLNRVKFVLGEWYQALQMEQKFDLIVSNPPYIDATDPHVEQLQYEPRHALIADNKGFADLIHIIAEAKNWLNPQGWLVLEHGYDQTQIVQKLFEKNHFYHIRSLQDYGGNDRVTLGQIKFPSY